MSYFDDLCKKNGMLYVATAEVDLGSSANIIIEVMKGESGLIK